jgi:hypothetical protein
MLARLTKRYHQRYLDQWYGKTSCFARWRVKQESTFASVSAWPNGIRFFFFLISLLNLQAHKKVS